MHYSMLFFDERSSQWRNGSIGEGRSDDQIGRGDLIQEKELVKFLVQGRVGGAGLDVCEDEPHVPAELFAMDNVVLAPHAAVSTIHP